MAQQPVSPDTPQPKKRNHAVQLTPWDKEVLPLFALYHYLTARQVMTLLDVRSYPNVSTRLKRLVDYEYLVRVPRGTRWQKLDSAYCFGKQGYAYCQQAGIQTRKPRTAKEEYTLSEEFFTRTLLATDILLAFRQLPDTEILTLQQDQALIGKPFVVTIRGEQRTFYADSTVVFTRGEKTYCCPIEVQHVGNFTRTELGNKAENYLALYEQHGYQQYFALPEDTVLLVLFVAVQGETAARNIRIALEQTLTHVQKPQLAPLFRSAPVPPDVASLLTQPVWSRPFDPPEHVRLLFPLA